MSSIAGYLNFEVAEPVDDANVMKLGAGIDEHASDGGGRVRRGPVSMIYRAFHTNQESRLEKQPLISHRGHILCWDGRLDNVSELASLLEDQVPEQLTDAHIVMHGYLNGGLRFLAKIIGDYALSLWDPESQSIVLARDHIGSRDLFYHLNNRRLFWCSDLRLLTQCTGVQLNVSEQYVAEYLTRLPDPTRTPFLEFNSVPPAHAVLVKDGRQTLQRLWSLSATRAIRYKSDSDYESHFREVFKQGVKACLRTDTPVWADLSGGLDSSSIVCMASQLINAGEVENSRLRTVSCIRDESPSSNETKFISCIEQHSGSKAHHVPESKFAVFDLSDYRPSIVPNPLDLFASYHTAVNKLMLQDGARVRLSGNGGDEILKSVPDPSPELADLFAERRLWQLHNQICAWGKDRKQPYLKLLWHAGLLPAFPRRLQIAFGRGPMSRLPDWFEPGFVRRTNLRELMLGPTDPFGFMLPSARMQACSFLSAVREISAGYLRMLQNVDIRFPLLHRPLVEFMQAIPSNQRLRLHETRSLQRRALRDLVPAEVLNRRSKGNPAEAIFRAVRREYVRLAPLFEDAYVARYGYVQQKALSAGLLRFVHGDQGAVWIPRIIQLEFWLRSLDRQREPFKINTAVSGSPVAQPTAV